MKKDLMVEGKPHVETYSEQELIRCKDCKWLLKHESGELECEIKAGWFPVKPDWYCADGEYNERQVMPK